MAITGMKIGGIPPFTEPVKFEFDERVNVFVGPNASGKSTVLSEMNLAFDRSMQEEAFNYRYREGKHPPSIWSDEDLELDAEYVFNKGLNYVSISDFADLKAPIVYLGPARSGLSTSAIGERIDSDETSAKELLTHDFSGESLRKAFDKSRIEADHMFEEQRRQRESGTTNVEYRAHNFFQVAGLAYSCAQSISSEIITSNRPRNYVTGLNLEHLEHQALANFEGVSIRRSLGVSTIDVPNFINVKLEHRPVHSGTPKAEPLDASFLSSGTQLTLLWIWWLALKMLHHYDFADGWEKQPAILLIDEIENHLHPTWQRRVIPALLEHFPGLQIFATTHSPFVVAGLKAGQVHMLKRDADGVITASTNEQDIIGWTTDEILRNLMGVEDPTDDATAAAARELRQLRDEGPRDTEDDEAARQERMQELRRLVDRDLLAGGPMAARRELFEQQFAEALEKYRQSQGLGQDGG